MDDHISHIQLKILMLCRLGATQLSMNVLRELMEVDPDSLETALHRSVESNWLEMQADGSISLRPKIPKQVFKNVDSAVPISTIMAMIEKVKDRKIFDQIPAKLIANAYRESGLHLEGATLLYECAQKLIKDFNLKSATRCCRECVFLLWDQLADREACGLFLNATLDLLSMFQLPMEGHDEIRQIQTKAQEVANRTGDQRSLAMLHFYRGRVKMHFHQLDEALAELEKGFALVDELGDKDMLARSAVFRAGYFFAKGLCRETVSNGEKALSFKLSPREQFDPNTIFELAISESYMGHLSRAIGLMDSSWRRSLRTKHDEHSHIFLQIFLGQMLLTCRKMEDSIYHLKEALKEATSCNYVMGIFWANRAIAYHHFLEGRYHNSYKTLTRCMAEIRQSGFQKLYYGIPVFLEMLFQFHKMGYNPIPGYSYSTELNAAINGPHVLLRGVALRIRAKELGGKGSDLVEINDLLIESEKDLERSGARYELAKTRAELALLELDRGAVGEAKRFATRAWDGWNDQEARSFPMQLQPLIDSADYSSEQLLSGKKLLSRYMTMTDDLMFAQEKDEIMIQLLSATCKFFEAERGGIFSLETVRDNPKFTLIKGLNIAANQVDKSHFAANMDAIQRAHDIWKPVNVRLPSVEYESPRNEPCYVICLPIHAGDDSKLVLYYDARYLPETLESFNELHLERIARHLENFISRSLEYSISLETKSSNTISEITKIKTSADELPPVLGEDFRDLIVRADQVAQSDASVIILGETGVGKGVLARRIHDMSPRSSGPFVSIDVSSIPESLVESELFGHEKGAFTGADRQKQGLMELANKGTLFIDEIGETPKAIQVKLLRAIEDRSFVRVGGVVKRVVDFRLLAATNRDLVKEVEKGNFREDLYYRLCVVPFIVPPLRERGDDVILLAEKFLAQYARKYNRSIPSLSAEQRNVLKSYNWPGNVRELRNVVERSVILSGPDKLQLAITSAPKTESPSNLFSDRPTLDELQRRYISQVMEETGGKLAGPSGAAMILGIKRSTLQHRMKKLGLTE